MLEFNVKVSKTFVTETQGFAAQFAVAMNCWISVKVFERLP